MPTSYLPLRWESTGDQWWYATPIDWAAANGHCDLVKQLLHIDPNLLIKLTSLRRIRRLETVWDDTDHHNEVAQCRAHVAQSLFLGCEPNGGGGDGPQHQQNLLIRAGYGGWLLYTAASAGDLGFVKDLLNRDPVCVLGEGEFGITDILYAAARSKNSEVFRVLLNSAIEIERNSDGNSRGCTEADGFIWEMMNRAVHAAARGGNFEVLKELLLGCSNVLRYRDSEGSTILHSASARGKVEVVKDLIATHDIIHSTDNKGNTALHVAAYRGYSSVVELLALASPSLSTMKNKNGDTFLHMAVAGFLSPGFHRINQQMELMKQLVNGKIVNLKDIVNVKNNEGRTALHIAVAKNIHYSVVEFLMTIPLIDLNVCDVDGMTPLDLLKQWPKTSTSKILVKQIYSAGGISNCENIARNSLARHSITQGISTSPGTSFRFADADLFLYTGNGYDSEVSCEPPSSRFSSCSSDPASHFDSVNGRKTSSAGSASNRLKFLLQWPRREQKRIDGMKTSREEEYNSPEFFKVCRNVDDTPTPLRQKFSGTSALSNNKSAHSLRGDFASPSTKERFATSLMHGVIQATPPKMWFSSSHGSPSSPFSSSSSPTSLHKLKVEHIDGHNGVKSPFFSGPFSDVRSQVVGKHRRVSSFNKSLMNQYFCFGAQGLAIEDSVAPTRASRSCRRLVF